MAIQYYKIKSTGKIYALDKTTGTAKKVSNFPGGITWGGKSLPSELTKALTKAKQPVSTKTKEPYTYTPASRGTKLPSISDAQYNTIRKMIADGRLTPEQAFTELQAQIGSQYSGTISKLRLYAPMEWTDPTTGERRKFATGGTGNVIVTARPTKTTIVTPEGTTTGVAFKDSDAYKSLSSDEKSFIDEMYQLILFGGEDEARRFSEAIAQAKAIADPYFKSKLILAEAEVKASIAEQNSDYEAAAEIINRAKDELLENVSLQKDFYSMEEQAEISRLTQELDRDVLRITDVAAEKGIGFATGYKSGERAETLRKEQFTGVVQSRQRRHQLSMKELELRASRGETTAQKQLEELKGKKGFALQRIGRGAEELLGSTRAGEIEGVTPTPGATEIGRIEETKRKSILEDVGAFSELQSAYQ